MKHLKKVLLILLFVVSFNNINAQDEDNPWAIELGTNAVDFYPTGSDYPGKNDGAVILPIPPPAGEDPIIGGAFEDFFNVDHWNTAAAISRLRVAKYVGSGFVIGLAGSFNSISKVGEYQVNGDVTYLALDLDVRYSFVKDSWFDPYLVLGGGGTWLDSELNPTLNGGIGFNFWFNDYLAFNVGSSYKHSFDSDKLLPHFQHTAGFVFQFGGKDADGDGIYDKYDACPEVAGLEEFNGCPDSDGDGIQDSEDACPNVAGLAELNGCPDADGDGIADKDDACPNEAGTKANNGCPDADGDGVVDKDDACPNEAGPAENKGCPWPDSDGDGILDKDDNCPNVIGVAENHGCPIVTAEVQQEITDLARAIYFQTGQMTFTDETAIRMEKVSAILNQYKTMNFDVEGHTDSTGSDKINARLSQERADAVRTYLVDHGFPADKIKAKGFGSSNPIGDNKTRKGRQENRRVEIFSEFAKR